MRQDTKTPRSRVADGARGVPRVAGGSLCLRVVRRLWEARGRAARKMRQCRHYSSDKGGRGAGVGGAGRKLYNRGGPERP